MAYETFAVHGSQLADDDFPASPGEAAGNAKRIVPPATREGRHDHIVKVAVELIQRHHYIRPGFANLAPPCRIQSYEKHLASPGWHFGYHSHFVSSKCVGVGGSRSWSLPSECSSLAASAHPARGAGCAEMTISLPRSSSSTSSVRPACWISGFGRRTPREFKADGTGIQGGQTRDTGKFRENAFPHVEERTPFPISQNWV